MTIHQESVQISVTDEVAEVRINRPHRLNTLDPAAHAELEEVWPHLQERPDVAAVVLCGADGVFCAGGDVKDMLAFAREHPGQGSGITITRARRLVQAVLDFDKPVVAAVEGRAYGLGATLALLCDLVVAARGSRFSDPHVDVGLTPGDGGAAVWTVLAGPHRARDLLLRGRAVTAEEVAALGIISELVEPGAAVARAHEVVREILARPRVAVRGTKVAVNAYVKAQFAGIFETALAWEVTTLSGADFSEALTALGEKRPPRFTQR